MLRGWLAVIETTPRLAAAEPDRADHQRDLSVSYNKLAHHAREAGDAAGARAYFAADLQVARTLFEVQPERADAAIDVALSLVAISALESD